MSSLISLVGQDQFGNAIGSYVSTLNGVETWTLWNSMDSTFEIENGSIRFSDVITSSPERYEVTTSVTQPSGTGSSTKTFLVPDGSYVHSWTSSGLTYKGYFQITYLGSSGGGGTNTEGGGSSTLTFDSNRAMTVTIDSLRDSGIYDIYQDTTLVIQLQHTLGTQTTANSTGPFPVTSEYTLRYNGTIIFYEPAVVNVTKVSCNFW